MQDQLVIVEALPPDLLPTGAGPQGAGPQGAGIDLDAKGAAYLADARFRAARERWEQSCPPGMLDFDLAHPSVAPFAGQLRAILEHTHGEKGILASGPTGRGKTRAMWQLMRRFACDEGRDCRYYSAAGWFESLQSRISYGRDEARGWVETVAAHSVVFIDDLGQQAILAGRQDWAMAWLFHFLDFRVSRKLGLYVTTNLTADQLADLANGRTSAIRSDPLIRRLLDLCEVIKI